MESDFVAKTFYVPQSIFLKEDVPIVVDNIGNLMLSKPFQISEDANNIYFLQIN